MTSPLKLNIVEPVKAADTPSAWGAVKFKTSESDPVTKSALDTVKELAVKSALDALRSRTAFDVKIPPKETDQVKDLPKEAVKILDDLKKTESRKERLRRRERYVFGQIGPISDSDNDDKDSDNDDVPDLVEDEKRRAIHHVADEYSEIHNKKDAKNKDDKDVDAGGKGDKDDDPDTELRARYLFDWKTQDEKVTKLVTELVDIPRLHEPVKEVLDEYLEKLTISKTMLDSIKSFCKMTGMPYTDDGHLERLIDRAVEKTFKRDKYGRRKPEQELYGYLLNKYLCPRISSLIGRFL